MSNKKTKIAMISPKLKVADVSSNVNELIDAYKKAINEGSDIAVFPELALTGVTCGDLFFHKRLYDSTMDGLKKIRKATANSETALIVGSYIEVEGSRYECSYVFSGGYTIGIIPKSKSANFRGIDYGRWFEDGLDVEIDQITLPIDDNPIPLGDIVLQDPDSKMNVVVSLGSDIFLHSSEESIDDDPNTTNIILNPNGNSSQMGTNHATMNYYKEMSKDNSCVYAYVSPGVYESTTDMVFSGFSFMVDSGEIISQSSTFQRETVITYGDVDLSKKRKTVDDLKQFMMSDYADKLLVHTDDPLPFIPKEKNMDIMCNDAFSIQATALANRLEHTNSKKALIGVSGGLDSTLALLVAVEAFRIMGKENKDIVTITMPGFGTSDRTFENAVMLMKLLGTDLREIPISKAVENHFEDINHDINDKNKAYENAQARERTQILMDIANDEQGLVVGTGDLSESAVGWCTFGGDHLAMYGVNGSIPKTLIPYILTWVAERKKEYSGDHKKLGNTLKSIIETPISPELLPVDNKGEITQKTEESVGPYQLHDYFIYNTLVSRLEPKEMLASAEKSFKNVYDRPTIVKWLKIFYSRFFSQQFKRNCGTEGPMVTQVSLSPRNGLLMASDASPAAWIDELE